MNKMMKAFGLLMFALVLANCNNKSSNNDATSYRWVNGICNNNQNQQVANTNCGALAGSTNYYYNSAGQCVDRTTSQIVNTNLCQSTSQTGLQQQCIGQYNYNGLIGTCSTDATGFNNCRGFQMISIATGQTVFCI